jgi:Holliday junction resolvase RusA-like endonuclease
MTRILTIVDPVHAGRPPMTMNEAHRAHWTAKKKARERLAWQIRAALAATPIPPMDRATITIVQHAPNAIRRDADGLGLFRKHAIDALVREGVLPDDNTAHVVDGGNRIEVDRLSPRIEIHLTEVAA